MHIRHIHYNPLRSYNRSIFFFFNDTATTEIYTLSLHDALPISDDPRLPRAHRARGRLQAGRRDSERQDGPAVAHPNEGGAGRPLAHGGPVPPRRLEPAHRHRASARALRDRALLGGAPPPDGMTTG